MQTRVSTKGQIVLPGPIRRRLGIRAGLDGTLSPDRRCRVARLVASSRWMTGEVLVDAARHQLPLVADLFSAHRIGVALAAILLLLAAILGFILTSWRQDRTATRLFAPFAAWVAFASVLNASIFALN